MGLCFNETLMIIQHLKCLCISVALNFYTSGQRIAPGNCNSSFVWKPDDVTRLAMMYTDWFSGEPSCGNGKESCLVLNDYMNYQWNDVSCDSEAFPICEIH